MANPLTIRIDYPASPLIENLLRIAARVLAERRGPELVQVERGIADVELALRPGIPAEGFRIENALDGRVRIAASDERGLFYGLGKYLRCCIFDETGFKPCAWRGLSAPRLTMRGIYFATHFHNFYQEAPVAEVERYIEDLALQGFNALNVWFDMHHFDGIDDPRAQAMLARLKILLAAARKAGMDAGLGMLANEGYRTTPAPLRAVRTGRAHYGVEVCVATPEGEALVLENMRQELEAFREIGLDFVWLWPYDQGGCACPACGPWGRKGMLKIGEKAARLLRSYFPKAKVVFSTWLFDYGSDQGEWAGLAEAFRNKPEWVDFILADSHSRFPRHPLEKGVPGGLPLLNFPEISMVGMTPWGGFGANPLLRRFSDLWGEACHLADGGFPYSEGIFEDVNKAAYAHFYWTAQNDPREAVEAYARFYFGNIDPAVAGRILELLEANHGVTWFTKDMLKAWGSPRGAVPVKGNPDWVRLPGPGTADAGKASEALRLCEQAEAVMPAWAKQGWRWRIIRLRAFLDCELMGNGGDPTPACEAAFRELSAIYHAESAEFVVSPPVPGRVPIDTSTSH